VLSVLDQPCPTDEWEVIVVNDSGKPLPQEEWQQSPRVRVIHTNRRERCFARNTGAAIALGQYLHFLDDDDYMLPGALDCLAGLTQAHPDAALLYGGTRIVNRDGDTLGDYTVDFAGYCAVMVFAKWVPMLASLYQTRAFFEIGGFDTFFSEGAQDIKLARHIASEHSMAGSQQIVAVAAVGEYGSTTNWAKNQFYYRLTSELLLKESGMFNRLRRSATAAYWHGRFVRIYLASCGWNMWNKQISTALTLGAQAVAGMTLTLPWTLQKDYWRALINPARFQPPA
jgi:glycosyltransferase involved in cell wall biosynthesis